MSTRLRDERHTRRLAGDDARARLLSGIPVTERRLELAGIPTALLEGGEGAPLVLLHDPSEHAAKWRWVLPDLTRSHRVIAPDLPGHGGSEVGEGPLDAHRVIRWLGELIERTCTAPPVLVGLILGGGIAARFAADHSDRLDALVLVDSLGLAPLSPTPEFGHALQTYLARPTEETHEQLWRYCAFDLDRMRERLGELWEPFTAYNLHRIRTPTGRAALDGLMAAFGMSEIPSQDLARIAVPTTLIWGRHDLATPVEVARAASARYGWPLHVIEDCADDPVIERPEAFLRALRSALDTAGKRRDR